MRLPAQSHSPSHNQGHVLSPSPGFNYSTLLGSGWRDYFAPSHADSPEQPGAGNSVGHINPSTP